jgi:hypothetical protein
MVFDSVSAKPAANATVTAVYRSNDPIKVNPTSKTDKDGVYTLNGLITGDYDIVATVPAENNTRRVAVQRLNIQTSNINGLTLTATNGSELNGQIRIDSGSVNGFRVGFGPEFQELPGPAIGAIPADAFTVRRLQPGNYRVSISRPESYPPSLYVKSIQMGRTEAVGGIVHVDGSTTGPLEITLGRNGGSIEGRVTDNLRQSAANVMVILVPDFATRPDLFKTATTDSNGAFRIQGIAPGGYLAYAWSWVPNGIWQNPEFLRSVERQGQRLTLSDGAMTELSFQLLADPD